MLNLSMSMASAIKSIRTNSYALNTTSHNIANIGNTSYSRQLANITASAPYSISGVSGQIGTGSDVSYIERIRDIYMDRQIRTAWMDYGEAQILDRTYRNLAAFFPEVNGSSVEGLGTQISAFYQAWDDVATAVTPLELQTALDNVYSYADKMSVFFNSISNNMTEMKNDLRTDLKNAVDAANINIRQIYELNKAITYALAQGQQPNDLLDKRDVAMAKLAENVNFDSATRTDGSVVILLGGRTLVNGTNDFDVLTVVSVGAFKDTIGVAEDVGAVADELNSGVVTGGKIGGILQSKDIVREYKAQLDILASSMVRMTNKIYSATAATGVTDGDFFSGDWAADIRVNKNITSGTDVKYELFQNRDIAKIMSSMKNMLLSKDVRSEPLSFANANALLSVAVPTISSGQLRINGVNIAVDSTMSIKDLVNAININVNEFAAVYNENTKEFFLVSKDPITIEADAGLGVDFLGDVGGVGLKLINEQVSASIVTTSPKQIIDISKTWNNQNNYFEYETIQSGTLMISMESVDSPITWTGGVQISVTTWEPTLVGISKSNLIDGKFVFGTKVGEGGVAGKISSFEMVDNIGNMTQTMKLAGNLHFNEVYEPLINDLTVQLDGSANMLASYKSSLEQLEGIQQSITQVDENEELARAKLYQRSYDASVKLMSVIDEMMNMLINRTGTQSSSLD